MIDIVVIADTAAMSPLRVYRAVSAELPEPVRSVVVMDRNTGLTNTFRNDDAVWSPGPTQ